MKSSPLTLRKALNAAYVKSKVNRSDMERFKGELVTLGHDLPVLPQMDALYRIQELEARIDELVYGLTDEEVRIVEEG